MDNVVTEVPPRPDRILLMGTEGVGKTTWAASSVSPIFICAEDGIPLTLDSVPRFPSPSSFSDVQAAVMTLLMEKHEYKTLVIDTVDWLEPMIWSELCERNKWLDDHGNPNIEKPGYGKGYVAATGEWRGFLESLETLRHKTGMEIVLLAHASIKNFANPAGEDYSRYECKLHKGAAALLKEWCDSILFAVYEEVVTDKHKGISTGRRVVHTERTAAWDAKNRHGLPKELPLDYQDYSEARKKHQPASMEKLNEEAAVLLRALKGERKTKMAAWLKKQTTPAQMAQAVDRLKGKIATMEDK